MFKDACMRCLTTHALNEDGERPCPKPPIVETEDDGVRTVIYKTNGFYTTDSRTITCANDIL